jgi:ProP effector
MKKTAFTSEQIEQALVALRLVYPHCFAAEGAEKHPLKIGIRHDILAEMTAMQPKMLRAALTQYVSDKMYRAACIEGAKRIGKDGHPAGFVTKEQTAHAAGKKRQHKEKQNDVF